MTRVEYKFNNSQILMDNCYYFVKNLSPDLWLGDINTAEDKTFVTYQKITKIITFNTNVREFFWINYINLKIKELDEIALKKLITDLLQHGDCVLLIFPKKL